MHGQIFAYVMASNIPSERSVLDLKSGDTAFAGYVLWMATVTGHLFFKSWKRAMLGEKIDICRHLDALYTGVSPDDSCGNYINE